MKSKKPTLMDLYVAGIQSESASSYSDSTIEPSAEMSPSSITHPDPDVNPINSPSKEKSQLDNRDAGASNNSAIPSKTDSVNSNSNAPPKNNDLRTALNSQMNRKDAGASNNSAIPFKTDSVDPDSTTTPKNDDFAIKPNAKKSNNNADTSNSFDNGSRNESHNTMTCSNNEAEKNSQLTGEDKNGDEIIIDQKHADAEDNDETAENDAHKDRSEGTMKKLVQTLLEKEEHRTISRLKQVLSETEGK